MFKKSENFDLRDLVRDAIVRRGLTETEAGRRIGMTAPSLRQIIDGGRALSAKAFNEMIDKWGIRECRAELQRWLIALLVDRLGHEGARWWKLAGWALDVAPVVAEDPGRELYAKLGDTRVQALRRLAILRVAAAAPEGVKSAALCSAGRETRDVIDTDVRALAQRGLLSSSVVRTTLQHVQPGGPERVTRQTALRVWVATEAGRAVVARMAKLPDIRGGAVETVGKEGDGPVPPAIAY